MNDSVTAFLPCRSGSQRVPRKNIRPFAYHSFGLIELKLSQLSECCSINQIILSTNDLEIIDYAESLSDPKLVIHRRSDSLAKATTSTDNLIQHARDLISSGHILWTHVTSPFVSSESYDAIVESYFSQIVSGYDSLMTVTPFRGFLWENNSPINYDRNIEKWPRTQTLSILHEINSAVFLASTDIYDHHRDRVGINPYLYELSRFTGYDIDWEEDFLIAEQLLDLGLVKT